MLAQSSHQLKQLIHLAQPQLGAAWQVLRQYVSRADRDPITLVIVPLSVNARTSRANWRARIAVRVRRAPA